MKNDTCGKIRPLLVDYSDGVLSADKTRQIAAHLAQCPACREELRLLEHSLALAREVWNEAATGEPLSVCNKPLAVTRRISRRTLVWIGGAVAACGVLIILLFYRPPQPKVEIDVMEYIAREERSARLAASVQLLADQPGLEQYKEDAERYLKEHYADTAAVRMLEKRQTSPN
jgi:predicted anti-sigma-YlaC factor YlaD